MTQLALLISPRASSAFFANAMDVAQAELSSVLGIGTSQIRQHGDMVFIKVDQDQALLRDLLRLSCVQGAFEVEGEVLRPVTETAGFALHPDFVWGEKYKGKTSETLTQLLINVALQQMPDRDPAGLTLLDPMCGRGTSLLWGMRFGMRCVGVEKDGNVHRDLTRSLKKWTKLHRQKHKLSDGWMQKVNKKGHGKYLDFTAEGTTMRVVVGDTTDTHDLTLRKPHDVLITDLPYGVQHQGGPASRSPLETVRQAAPGWVKALAKGGAMAIAYNAYIPKRDALIACFDGLDVDVIERPLQHRMSESILRDVLILKKT